MCKNKEYKINRHTNTPARFCEIKYFGTLFHFYLSSVIGCFSNSVSLFNHIAVVIIEEDGERAVGRLNRTLEDCKINPPCNIQHFIIARNERPKISNAFLVT